MLSRLVIFFSAVEYSFEKDYVVGKRKKKDILSPETQMNHHGRHTRFTMNK